MSEKTDYHLTSEQLDSATATVITTLLAAFVVSQNFISDASGVWQKYAAVFATITLLLHYISYLTAHFAQIYRLENKEQLEQLLGYWTGRINKTVYLFVVILFIISMIIIIKS